MSVNYIGVIIEESLDKRDILEKVKILKKKIEKVTEKHKTPWLKKWTILSVEIPAEKAAKVADELSNSMASAQNWYADFKNDNFHFIIFKNKVFRVSRINQKEYAEAKKYGLALGIPEHQIDFK